MKKSEFLKKEYELLRFLISTNGKFTKKAEQKLNAVITEILGDKEYLKYAIEVNEDRFGVKQLNGVVTVSFMLMEIEKLSPKISNKLMETLLFEYQDKSKKVPLILTGEKALQSPYLEFLLVNTEYRLKDEHAKVISKYVVKSIKKKFNATLLTLYFNRKDISMKLKKSVIDSLDETVLYRLIRDWEDNLIGTMFEGINLNFLDLIDDEFDKIQDEFEGCCEEKESCLSKVMKLISEKLCL